MRTVWKFPANHDDDDFSLILPLGARVVHFAPQNGELCLWATVDTDQPPTTRWFGIRGTGHPWDDEDIYLASCEQGPFVWHLVQTKGDL